MDKEGGENESSAHKSISDEEEELLLSHLDQLRQEHRGSRRDYEGNTAMLLYGPRRLMARGALATIASRKDGRKVFASMFGHDRKN